MASVSELYLKECMRRSPCRIASAGRVDNYPGLFQVLISNLLKIVDDNHLLTDLS